MISLSVFLQIQQFPNWCCFFLLGFSEERATLTLPGWFASGLEHHLFNDPNILSSPVQFVNIFCFLCRICIQIPFLSQLTQSASTLSRLSTSPTTPRRSTRCSSRRGCLAGRCIYCKCPLPRHCWELLSWPSLLGALGCSITCCVAGRADFHWEKFVLQFTLKGSAFILRCHGCG